MTREDGPTLAQSVGEDGAAAVAELQGRVTNLEVKLSYAEDTLEKLNAVVVEQGDALESATKTLEAMRRVVVEVRAQMGEAGDVEGALPEQDPVPNSG